MNNDKKIVGILGGMGPYATAMFFSNLLDLTPSKKDWDHIRIIIDNNPHIPSRTRAVLYDEKSPVEGMIDSCRRLANYPVDFIVLPCNSACYFLPEVQKNVKTPILNIISITADALHSLKLKSKKVAVLGGMVTYKKGTYEKPLWKRGLQPIRHDEDSQHRIADLIEDVKRGNKKSDWEKSYKEIIQSIKTDDPGCVVLACTELSLFKNIDIGVPVVDSSCVLADYAVQIALGKKPIPVEPEHIHEFWDKRSHMLSEGKVSAYQATLLTSDSRLAEERDRLEKEMLVQVVENYNGRKGNAIEFGCGVGRLTELLSGYFENIDAVDYCKTFITIAKEEALKKRINNINYFVSSVEDFKAMGKYDCALSAGLMIFLTDKQFGRLVRTIANGLKPGGICIIRESMGYLKRFELHGFYSETINDIYNAVYRTSDEIINEFSRYSFKLRENRITLPPAPQKPETCQKIIVLEKP